ncbi:MAG: DUF1660 family phage protein [Candidatus Hydrothermarchaeota archaeon]
MSFLCKILGHKEETITSPKMQKICKRCGKLLWHEDKGWIK